MENHYTQEIQQTNTDVLVYIFFLCKDSYSEEYIELIKNELTKRGYDFISFDENQYIKFVTKDFHKGWEKELLKMFQELKDNGWNMNLLLDYKYSWGQFQLKGFRTNANEQLLKIIDKYKLIFESTCCECGSKNSVLYFENEYLCDNCTLNILKKREITDINEFGFEYYNGQIYENEKGRIDKIYWEDIKQIKIEKNYDVVNIEMTKLSKNEEEINENISSEFIRDNYISFSSDFHINFFELLRYLPKNILDKKQKDEVENLLINIKKCTICDKTSILIDKCLVCSNLTSSLTNPSKLAIKLHGTIENIITYEKQEFIKNKEENTVLNYIYYNDKSFK